MSKSLSVASLAALLLTGCTDESLPMNPADLEEEKRIAAATFDSIFVGFRTLDKGIAPRILAEECLWIEKDMVKDCAVMNDLIDLLEDCDRCLRIDSSDVVNVSARGETAWVILSNNQTWRTDGEWGTPTRWIHSGVLTNEAGTWKIVQYHGHNTSR